MSLPDSWEPGFHSGARPWRHVRTPQGGTAHVLRQWTSKAGTARRGGCGSRRTAPPDVSRPTPSEVLDGLRRRGTVVATGGGLPATGVPLGPLVSDVRPSPLWVGSSCRGEPTLNGERVWVRMEDHGRTTLEEGWRMTKKTLGSN